MTRARSNNNNGSSGRHTNKSIHNSSRISKSSYGSSNNHHRYLSNHNGLLNNHPINNDNNNNIGVRAYSTTFVSLDHNLYNNIQGDKNSAPSSTPFLASIENASSSTAGVVVDGFQGHGSPRIEFGSSKTTALPSSSLSGGGGGGGGDNQEAQEMMLLKREAYRELASQTQRFDELFIAKMIYWESLGLEEKSRWLEGGQVVEEEEEMEDEEEEFEDDLEDEEERSQHNNYFHRPTTTTRTHRRVRREKRDEMDDLVTALECRATVKDYSALLAFEKQQALRHGPNHTHVHGLLPQDQDVLW